MNSKLYIIFAMCIFQVSAVTYDDAVKNCKKEHGIEKDEPLDYFLAKGEFQPGFEHLKCFFSCMTSQLKLNDASENPDGAKIVELAKSNPQALDLQLFAQEPIRQACLPGSDQSDACGKTFSFVHCAVDLKNKSEQPAKS